ncbi:MAG: hypothetical protein SFY68_14830 [Candidatus Sumerlaeia bacterium]|nr:hypothetical protein [Candidatus Sumerlaeia bacterium]
MSSYNLEECRAASLEFRKSRLKDILYIPVPHDQRAGSRIDAKRVARNAIHAIAVGRKQTNGKTTSSLCVTVFVTHKIPRRLIEKSLIPDSIDGIPTDVVEIGIPQSAAGSLTNCPRPNRPERRLTPGISIANASSAGYGTISCFCKKEGHDPALFLLSNSHVLAPRGGRTRGTDIFQPNVEGDDSNPIATLWDSVPLRAHNPDPITFDAAIARLVSPWHNRSKNEICGQPAISQVGVPTPEVPVAKFGASTLVTEGRIGWIDYIGPISYAGVGLVQLQGQLLIRPSSPEQHFCGRGDSGSLIVDPTGSTAYGIICARVDDPERGGHFCIASPLTPILEHFRLSLA